MENKHYATIVRFKSELSLDVNFINDLINQGIQDLKSKYPELKDVPKSMFTHKIGYQDTDFREDMTSLLVQVRL